MIVQLLVNLQGRIVRVDHAQGHLYSACIPADSVRRTKWVIMGGWDFNEPKMNDINV